MLYRPKKNRIFIETYWTVAMFVYILYALSVTGVCAPVADGLADSKGTDSAGMAVKIKLKDAIKFGQLSRMQQDINTVRNENVRLSRDLRVISEERKTLQKELLEILERFRQQNESYRRLQLSVAATIASGKVQVASPREGQLIKAIGDISDNGRSLALKTIEFCDSVDSVLKQMPLGKVRQAELQLRLEDLKSEARKLSSLADMDPKHRNIGSCRILAVERDLQIVVLPVGSVHGAFNGLNFFTGKEKAKLRLVTVRPFVSAAVLEEGNIDDMAPGMEAVTDLKQLKQ